MLNLLDDIMKTYEIKKSKFIVYLYKVDNVSGANKYLDELRAKYKDATHVCYAYKIGPYEKYSDDGEPQGTAGIPILDVIKGKNIDYVLAVVVRYFGGIKLGAGGLIRSYRNTVKDTIDDANVYQAVDGKQIEITLKYSDTKNIDYLLKDKDIVSKSFNDDITYIVNISNNDIDILDGYNYIVLSDIKIKKI